jgi:hypothetical protein
MKATLVSEFGLLTVVRLGKTDWRVSSGSNPDDLLGYIERQRSGRFEVTWMTDPMRWGYAASFDEALVAFGDSVRFTGEILDNRAQVVGVQRDSVFHPARRSSWVKSNGRSSVA